MPKAKKDKVHLLTMGCSKNTVDSEVVMAQLRANNWELTENPEDAGIGIINTCGFIEAAKNESIQTILQAVEMKKQGKLNKVIVMGCLSERYANELRKEIPEVDAYIGANKMDEVVRTVGGEYKDELLGERLLTTPRHYAYLKISEGCDNPCAFCAIPIMRGGHVSKPMERVLLEGKRLAALGVKELIIIAQDSTYYGLDMYGRRALPELLERLAEIDGIEWIRLMYAFPAKFPMELIDTFKRTPKVCRYLDMPIQHISDSVLKSMRRGISSRALRELIGTIRAEVPGIALRTTLITGYPAETEEDFAELLEFVKETKFDRLGIFTYSQEDDTFAYPLGDPIPEEVKENRRNLIMEAQREISLARNESIVGKTMRILVDQKEGATAFARTEHDAPEVDNEVTIDDGGMLIEGRFYDVEIVDSAEYDLFAVPAMKPEGTPQPTAVHA
ncbi:MAG TPA: 30S ribosomal protein S12 methylthiotransferase RimO [Bacteroidota bacterium]|nr:30S ribosomal protein S12 methylthiotransferase RimO [Bacteroidota bacterium]